MKLEFKYSLLILFAAVLVHSGSYAQSDGDYQSRQTGDWTSVTTWQVFNSGSFHNLEDAAAGTFQNVIPSSSSGIITMMTGTVVSIPNGQTITADQIEFENIPFSGSTGALVVAAGGTLIINNGSGDDVRLLNDFVTFASLQVAGTLQLNTGATMVDDDYFNLGIGPGPVTSLTYQVLNGGVHIHTTGAGVDVIPDADWQTGSTCQINATSGAVPSIASTIAFYNFVWNGSSQSIALNLAGQLSTINGDFTVRDTNNQFLLLSQNSTLTILGNFFVQNNGRVQMNSTGNSTFNIGGNLNISSSSTSAPFAVSFNATGTSTINISGDFIKSNASVVNMAVSTGTTNLNVLGNFSITGGTLTKGSGPSTINFNGSTTTTFTNSASITGSINYVIAALKTLNTGTSALTGSGNLTLNGTIGLGSVDASGALQTGTLGGNIRVSGTRTYSSGSTIVYNGASTQFIGNGFPSGGDVNLTINNSNNVTLSTSLDIVALRTLNLASGNIVIGTQTLTINGTVTGSGGIVGGPNSKMVIGGTGNFGTLTFNGTNQLLDFTLQRTSSGLITLGGDLTILGTFTQTDGDLALNGHTLTISGNFNRTAGNISSNNSSTLVIDASGTLPATVGFSGSGMNTLTLNRASATLSTTASLSITNLNLLDGTFSNGTGIAIATGGTITRSRSTAIMSNPPNNTTNTYNVAYNNSSGLTTGAELPTNTTALANLTLNGSGVVTLSSDITVNGIMTLNTGSLDAGANAIDMKGNLVSNTGSTLTSSLITFSGTTNITGTTAPIFGDIIISGTLTPSANFRVNGNITNNGTLNSSSGSVTFGGTTTITGNVCTFNNVIITGTLNGPTNMNVAGTWNNTGTFNRGLASNNVTFTGTTTFTGPGTTNFSSITISGTLNSSATLRVAGNFTNNGTFNAGTGTLLLNGTSVQSLGGTTTSTFNNITVTNNANPLSVRVQSNQNIRGILTLSANSIFDADGSSNTAVFTLLSTNDEPAVVDAAIATLPSGAQVQGSVTVQRYMSIEGGSNSPSFNNGRIYRYISSPVAAPTVSQIQAFNPITGTFTGTSTCSGCIGVQSMFLYNESVITDTNGSGVADLNDGYEDFPQTINSETLATGRGYAMFVWGNVPPVSTVGNARWSVRNPINSGTINFVTTAGVSFTAGNGTANDGWNLVGNPYPSTIDWDAVSGWTRTNVNNAIYMKDNGATSGTYATYVNGIPSNGGSQYIPMGQAFWVKSDAGPVTFQATESVKSPGSTTTFFKTSPPPDLLRVTLRKDTRRDEMVVYFRAGATEEFDGQLDAYKLKNDIFNLSSVTPTGVKLAINGLPELECSKTINLDITNVSVGNYQLDFTEFESFVTPVNIILKDNISGENIDVKSNPSYAFQVTAQESSYKDRFSITLTKATPDPTLLISSVSKGTSCKEGSVTLGAEGAPAGGSYKWYESADAVISISGQNGSQFITPSLTKSKTYFVTAVSAAGCEGVKVPVEAQVVNFDDAVVNDLGNGVLSSNFESGNQWFKDGQLISGATGQTFTPLESGVYKVEVTIETCTTSAERAFTVTGIAEDRLPDGFLVYPNPVENTLTVETNEFSINPRIVDLTGRELGRIEMRKSGNHSYGTFDFRGYPTGIYILQVTDGETKVWNKRISKK